MKNFLILTMCFLLMGCVTGSTGTTVPSTKAVKVLSINLCADWNAPRSDRANKIVDLIRAEQVDIVLVQEGVRGIGQFDAVKYMADRLGYSYTQTPTFGVPGFLEYCVGIMTSHKISDTRSPGCQVEGGDLIDKMPFPGASRGIMADINGVTVMSSHLTVPVAQDQKEKQVKCLMGEFYIQGPVIWGGDFNFFRTDPAYKLINLQEAGYSGAPQVDMIFVRGFKVISSKLVFEDHYVSDHFGVLIELERIE